MNKMNIPPAILAVLRHRCTVNDAVSRDNRNAASWYYLDDKHNDLVKAFVTMYTANERKESVWFIHSVGTEPVDHDEDTCFAGNKLDDVSYSQVCIGLWGAGFNKRNKRGEGEDE